MNNLVTRIKKSDLGVLFWQFFKNSTITFGGGMVMIPMLNDEFAKKRQWFTEEEMLDAIATAQSLPGAIIINLAVYLGRVKAGIKGSVAAVLGAVLPPFIAVIIVVHILEALGQNPYVEGFLMGVKAAACGLIVYTVADLGLNVNKKNIAGWIVTVAAFVAVVVFKINIILIVLGAATYGVIRGYVLSRKTGA